MTHGAVVIKEDELRGQDSQVPFLALQHSVQRKDFLLLCLNLPSTECNAFLLCRGGMWEPTCLQVILKIGHEMVLSSYDFFLSGHLDTESKAILQLSFTLRILTYH